MKRSELKSRKLDIVVGIFIIGLVSFALGVQGGYSWTGTWNSLSNGYMEVQNVNASNYFLDDTNITARLTGNWGSTNLTTTGAVSTADLNFTSEFYYNGENRTDLIASPSFPYQYNIETDGTTYTASNGSTGQIDFSGTNGSDVFLDVLETMTEGGEIHFGLGDFDFNYDIEIPTKNWFIITGEGSSASSYQMETTGGTILNFNSARFTDPDGGLSYKVHLKALGILFEGSYTETPWFMPDTFLLMDNVYIKADCSLPDGDSNAVFMQVGSAGPVGATYKWNNVQFMDSRNGGNLSKLLYFHVESAVWDGMTVTVQPHDSLNETGVLFWFGTVSWMTIRDLVLFTDSAFDSANNRYKYQFYYGAGVANLILDTVQFLPDDDIAVAHIQCGSNGYLWVTLRNHPVTGEAGYNPVDISTSGSGLISFISEWFVTPDDHGATSAEWDYITLGETVAAAGIIVLKDDGTWNNSDADGIATGDGLLAFCPRGGSATNSRRVVYSGWIRDDTWTFTIGQKIYLSTTAGALTGTAPSGSSDVVRLVGHAVTADIVWLHPDNYYTIVP